MIALALPRFHIFAAVCAVTSCVALAGHGHAATTSSPLAQKQQAATPARVFGSFDPATGTFTPEPNVTDATAYESGTLEVVVNVNEKAPNKQSTIECSANLTVGSYNVSSPDEEAPQSSANKVVISVSVVLPVGTNAGNVDVRCSTADTSQTAEEVVHFTEVVKNGVSPKFTTDVSLAIE